MADKEIKITEASSDVGEKAVGEEAAADAGEKAAGEEAAANAGEKAADKEKGKKKNKKSKNPKKQLTEKQKTVRALRRLITKIIVLAAIVTVLLTVVGSVAICHDNNMFPAVCDGDLIITYRLGGYYNGDIVVYEVGDVKRIGRVVGIPGDIIDIKHNEGYYMINGTMPYETIYFATRKAEGSTINFPYTIKEGEVFIFNDMRDDTYDSRLLGGIKNENLKGKVVLLIRRRGF